MRLKTYENLFLIFLCAIAILSGYKLFLPPNYFAQESSTGIAIFQSIDNVVMEKGNNEISWKASNQDSKLNNGDLVYTHKNSQAKIKITEGPELNLYQNTLIKIVSNENKNKIDVKKGLIYARITDEMDQIQINLAGKEYVLSAQEADIQIKTGKDSKITVVSGALNVAQIANKDRNLIINQNEQASFKNDEIKVDKLAFVPKYPENKYRRFSRENKKISLRWKTINKKATGQLLISKTPEFEKPFRILKIGQTSEMNIKLPFGKFYWMIKQDSKDKVLTTSINEFSLLKEKPIKLLIPYDGEKYFLNSKNDLFENKIFLKWKQETQNRNENYRVEITDPKGITQNREIDQTKLNTLLNQFGKYQYRVKVNNKNRPEAIWSKTSKFEILKRINLPMPKILFPKDNSEFVPYQKQSIKLSWLGIKNVSHYLLKLDINGKEEIKKLNSNQYEFSPIKNAQIKWSVIAKNKNHQSLPTPIRTFFVNLPVEGNLSPQKGVRIELDRPDQEVEFKWSLSQNAPLYLFELAKDSDFNNIVESQKTNDIKIKTTIKNPGVYFWRAKILLPNGKIKYSRPQEVQVSPSPPPKPIKLIPKKTIEMNLNSLFKDSNNALEKIINFLFPIAHAKEEMQSINLQWEPSQKAKTYIIEIYQNTDEKALLTKEIKESQFNFKVKNYGKYFWRVAIIDYWDRKTDFSNFSEIEIVPRKQLLKTALRLPKHGIELLEPLPRKIRFLWQKLNGIQKYEFLISEDLEFTKIIFQKEVMENEISISINDIPNKENLYWRVISHFKENDKTLSYRRRFSIKVEKPVLQNLLTDDNKNDRNKKIIDNFVQFSFAPQATSYSQESINYEVDLSGSTTPGIDISSGFIFKEFFLTSQFSRHWGTVFDNISYQSTRFSLLHKINKCFLPQFYDCHAGIQVNQISTYDQISSTLLSESAQFGFSAVAKTTRSFKVYKNHMIHASAQLGLGSLFHLGFNLNWKKKINQKFYYLLESKNSKTWGSLNEHDVDLTTSSIEAGLGYFFN